MRTTLTIDDAVMKRLRDLARRTGRPFKDVVNDMLRAGLDQTRRPPQKRYDANLLISAVDADSPHHRSARTWLERTLSGSKAVDLPWVVLLAFLRITTRPGILRRQQDPEDALEYEDSWLRQPCVEPVAPGPNHRRVFRNLLAAAGTAGNLTTDAHLAAMCLPRRLCRHVSERNEDLLCCIPRSRSSGTSPCLLVGCDRCGHRRLARVKPLTVGGAC